MDDVITIGSTTDLRLFLGLQTRIYDGDSPAIPLPEFEVRRLLDVQRNPALRGRSVFLLLVRHRGEAVARCSLVLPKPGDHCAMFGFFECVDDPSAASLLFEHAADLCRCNGVHALHGPFSPVTSGVTGVQLDGFDQPNSLYEACSPPYYARLLEHCGFEVERRGRTWRSTTLRADMEALAARLPERATRYSIRCVSLRDLRQGMEDLAAVFDAAFRENWGRETMSLDEYFYVARFLLPAWQPDSLTVVYDGQTPAGALLCLPDINAAFRYRRCEPRLLTLWRARRLAGRSRTLLTFAMGMHPDYQHSAAGLLLARHMALLAQRYDSMCSTWITEGNAGSERMAERFGLAPWKTYAVYHREF